MILEARNISKAFPGVQALQDVGLRLERGEVLAIVGENGAGKSTLMKILGGVLTPDSGTIHFDGRPVVIKTVEEAQQLGIALIHQELNLADNLDVAGNVFLGREPTWGGPLRLVRRRINTDAQRLTRRIGLDCPPTAIVSQLAPGQQQLVEIARALSLKARIIIMDEPTSSLTLRETERLFQVIRDLKTDGVSVLYISHRLAEVEKIADRVVVLRDGRNAGELERAAIRHEAIVRLMVGRDLKKFFVRTHPAAIPYTGPAAAKQPLLRVRNLRWAPKQTRTVDLDIHSGEILGMAGLMGAGRTEFAEALYGVRPRISGDIFLDGRLVRIRRATQAIKVGVFLVPEDRRVHGLVPPAGVRHNISLGSLDRLQWLRLVALRRERELARRMCDQLNVRTPGLDQQVALLSGGNQQKVVLAKWLCRTPRVLILDEPTRGIDVGAKAEIYALMDRLAGQGVAILMISSDLEEILGMSDRVVVMHQGSLAGELSRDQLSEEAIMHLATGGKGVKKLAGMAVFLFVLYAALLASHEGARSLQNHKNLGKDIGLYGVISIGAGLLIISGGIDLSIGSVIGLSATAMVTLLVDQQWPPVLAGGCVLLMGAGIGLLHGGLVTKLRVPAFVVTLCGLFIYRGLARWVGRDESRGLGNQFGELKDFLYRQDVFGVPKFLVFFLVLSAVVAVFLHFSVYGRYLFAIGNNEKAARYSGIATDRYRILAYVLCSTLASLFGILFLMEQNSVQPSESGSFFELYAIAGAVLGGCSLRGGEGNVVGIMIGTTILWILPKFANMWGVPDQLKYTVIGGALLLGALVDELLRPRSAST